MRFSADATFDAAQGNELAICNLKGGAVSKDILVKIFCKNLWDKTLRSGRENTGTLTKCYSVKILDNKKITR